MKRTYKGWKISLHTSIATEPRATIVSPSGADYPQPWLEGKDELDMFAHAKRRIDKIIGFDTHLFD